MKIIVIGPNKCATTTLHHFFERNAIASIHWDQGNLALRCLNNLSGGQPLLKDYPDYQAFSDFYYLTDKIYISPLAVMPRLIEEYRDEAVFILNTRHIDSWIASRNSHRSHTFMKPTFQRRHRKVFSGYIDQSTEYTKIHSLCKLIPSKRLHRFELEDENKFELLADFLEEYGFDIAERSVEIQNKSK